MADALSTLFEEKRKELVKDVHRLALMGVHLMSISDSVVTI